MFEDQELIYLVEHASTLQERLQGPFKPKNQEASDANWAKWKKVAAQDDDEVFQKRLALWELDPSQARARLGEVEYLDPKNLPSWVIAFQAFMEKVGNQTHSSWVCKPDLPFHQLLNPLLQVARSYLMIKLPDVPCQLHNALVSMLAEEWSALLTPSLYMEFSIFRLQHMAPFELLLLKAEERPTECYDQFTSSFDSTRWKTFFLEYCVLARLVVQKLESWLEVAQEFCGRYDQDRPDIEAALLGGNQAILEDISGNLSDSHHGGRSVFLLRFAEGKRVMYKPRNLDLEALFDRFATDCTTENDGQLLDLKAPVRVLRDGYGWEEYIEHKPCQSAAEGKEFFQRAGQLLALVYVLAGTDIHYENLIAHGKYPVLIDLEMLFDTTQHSLHTQSNAQTELAEALKSSVMQTGFLPTRVRARGKDYNVGGLDLTGDFQYEGWLHLNTDAMKKGRLEKSSASHNTPSCEGMALQLSHHQGDLEEGFRNMYACVQSQKEKLLEPSSLYHQFQHLQKRFIIKPTLVYDHFLRKSYRPEFLRSGLENSFVFETLFVFVHTYDADSLKNFTLELQQLERGDIPFFQRAIASGSKGSSGFEKSAHIIHTLGSEDLNFQLSLIHVSVELSHASDLSLPAVSQAQKQFTDNSLWLEEAIYIKDLLLKTAHKGSDGSLSWYAIVPEPFSENKKCLTVLDSDFYSGALGVALFFSTMAHITEEDGLHQAALKTLHPALDALANAPSSRKALGLDGIGAYVYTLALIGKLSDQPGLHHLSHKIVGQLSKQDILRDRSYDIISGSASCILGLLALYTVTGSEESLEKAVFCGDHLLNQREKSQAGHQTWKSLSTFLTGFSHGAAGIAYALLRLFEQTGEKRFFDAALEAIEYERTVFLASEGNWPDFRPDSKGKVATSWCHGAPGIGLARVGALSLLQDQKVLEEIEIAAQTTIEYGYQNDERLCCGDCGRIEYLLTAGLRLNRPEWVQQAREYAAHLATSIRENRGKWKYHPFVNPGLFLGLSGLGYTFLRCAAPDKVPSILLLETVA